MTDPSAIAAALTSLKTAIDIANVLRSTDTSLEAAEMKLKLADLLGNLADAKMQVVDLQDLIRGQAERIGELNAALEIKGDVELRGDAYYLKGQSGPEAGPYCLRCWQQDHKLRRIVRSAVGVSASCPACGASYDRRSVNLLGPV